MAKKLNDVFARMKDAARRMDMVRFARAEKELRALWEAREKADGGSVRSGGDA